jgi:hypothetical protein
VADELNTPELWKINQKLETLASTQKELGEQQKNIMRVLDGMGHEPGMRQQLRELRHAIEGNPPAMRGVVLDMSALIESHNKLRRDFETFVDTQNKASATRQGTIVGVKTMWGLVAGGVVFLGTLFYLLTQIQNAISKGGG